MIFFPLENNVCPLESFTSNEISKKSQPFICATDAIFFPMYETRHASPGLVSESNE